MTFDEAIEELKSESTEAKEIIERAEILAKLYNEYGVEIKEGTGRTQLTMKDKMKYWLWHLKTFEIPTFILQLKQTFGLK